MKIDNIKKSKHIGKRFMAVMLTAIIAVSSPTFVQAAEQSGNKEEVVYGILNQDGSVNGIYVVNIFDYKGDITDYGDYSSVRNMTTQDNITLDEDKISVTNTSDKLYYEGIMNGHELPWNISLKYYIDEKEYSADEIAGKSGALSIKLQITKNENCDESFYKNYALQATFTLDTNKCTNIVADNATIANVGSDKQIAYTILPDKGADITITADVNDFEMKAVTINGVKLNMDVQIDDSELMEQVRKLTDGVNKLDNGTSDLQNGVSDLSSGANQLDSGAKELKDGASNLDVGAKSLQEGIKKVQDALNELNSNSETLTTGSGQVKAALIEIQSSLSKVSFTADKITELVDASSKIKTAINQINAGIDSLNSNVGYAQYKVAMQGGGLNIDQLVEGNNNAIATLTTQIATLTDTYNQIKDVAGYESQAAELMTQIDQLTNVVALLGGNNAAIGGTEVYLNNLQSAVSQLNDGVSKLNQQYETFDAAIVQLGQSLSGMLVDMSRLSSGINTLVDKYTELDKGINDYTSGVAQIVAGYQGVVNGIEELSLGSEKLADGNATLYDGTNSLVDGVGKLYNGSVDLKDGSGELKDKTSNMESDVNTQIDDVLSKVNGDQSDVVSFTSEKNINIKSVQFVLKTQAIEKEEVTVVAEKTTEKLNIWEKIIGLFQ
jgi:putative membrane protein